MFPLSVTMDSDTTIKDLKEIVRAFCEERDWSQFHNPKDLAIGMATESSELLQIFRFKTPEESAALISEDVTGKHIKEELSDILYFVLRFAQMNNIDLSSELESKIKKNAEKYPLDKSTGSNKKYDEL